MKAQNKRTETAKQLMEILSIGKEEAIQLLTISNDNIEAAIHLHCTSGPLTSTPPSKQLFYNSPIDVDQPVEPNIGAALGRPNRRQLFHGLHREKGAETAYKKTYMIKKRPKRGQHRGKGRDRARQGEKSGQKLIEEDIDLQTHLEKLLGKRIHVSFTSDLYEVFEKMLSTKKLVGLHCLSFDSGPNKLLSQWLQLSQLYSCAQFVQSVNKAFINYGVDPMRFDFDHYPFMKEMIRPQQDLNSIVILRLNELTYKPEVFRKIRIPQALDIRQPNKIKTLIENIRREANMVAFGSSTSANTLTTQEKLKIEQDRLLRAQQEQEYFFNNPLACEKEKEICLPQKEIYSTQKERPQLTPAQRRVKIRSQLPDYKDQQFKDGICFKIRLPNSSLLELKIPKTEEIGYLFKFIESYDSEAMGFENEPEREFDLLQPQQRLYLKNRYHDRVEEVFGDSTMETLVVKEL